MFTEAAQPIVVVGDSKTAFSIVVCLLKAHHSVLLVTSEKNVAKNRIHQHLDDINTITGVVIKPDFKIVKDFYKILGHEIAIVITGEHSGNKREVLKKLEQFLPASSAIAINSESISLSELQENAKNPERLLIANWSEPAHTTYFLELVVNSATSTDAALKIFDLATTRWGKDPYFISHDTGIRSLLFSAMAREALYLVENGFSAIDDIDRACRNDPGYYLPFAGNLRYMDLMGTNAYGIVMKTLNRELSKNREQSQLMNNIIEKGGRGMENNHGFYKYQPGEAEKCDEIFRRFTYDIREIISAHPPEELNSEKNLHKPGNGV